MKNKNLICSGINFAAGFTVAALFLSTLIPKFQYWITRMKYRWEETNEEKDRRAYQHVSNNFIDDIKSLTNETGFTTIRLQTMDYKLKPIVEFLYNAQL